MTVYELARLLMDTILTGNACEVDNIYFKDRDGNFHNISSHMRDDDNDVILLEEY